MCGFRPDYSRGAAGALHSLPFGRNQKNPEPMTTDPGITLFYPQTAFVSTPLHARFVEHAFRWQVFWLPRPSSDLPIPMHWNSGTKMLKEFPFPQREDGVTAAGPLPSLTGFPIKPRRAPSPSYARDPEVSRRNRQIPTGASCIAGKAMVPDSKNLKTETEITHECLRQGDAPSLFDRFPHPRHPGGRI